MKLVSVVHYRSIYWQCLGNSSRCYVMCVNRLYFYFAHISKCWLHYNKMGCKSHDGPQKVKKKKGEKRKLKYKPGQRQRRQWYDDDDDERKKCFVVIFGGLNARFVSLNWRVFWQLNLKLKRKATTETLTTDTHTHRAYRSHMHTYACFRDCWWFGQWLKLRCKMALPYTQPLFDSNRFDSIFVDNFWRALFEFVNGSITGTNIKKNTMRSSRCYEWTQFGLRSRRFPVNLF